LHQGNEYWRDNRLRLSGIYPKVHIIKADEQFQPSTTKRL